MSIAFATSDEIGDAAVQALLYAHRQRLVAVFRSMAKPSDGAGASQPHVDRASWTRFVQRHWNLDDDRPSPLELRAAAGKLFVHVHVRKGEGGLGALSPPEFLLGICHLARTLKPDASLESGLRALLERLQAMRSSVRSSPDGAGAAKRARESLERAGASPLGPARSETAAPRAGPSRQATQPAPPRQPAPAPLRQPLAGSNAVAPRQPIGGAIAMTKSASPLLQRGGFISATQPGTPAQSPRALAAAKPASPLLQLGSPIRAKQPASPLQPIVNAVPVIQPGWQQRSAFGAGASFASSRDADETSPVRRSPPPAHELGADADPLAALAAALAPMTPRAYGHRPIIGVTPQRSPFSELPSPKTIHLPAQGAFALARAPPAALALPSSVRDVATSPRRFSTPRRALMLEASDDAPAAATDASGPAADESDQAMLPADATAAAPRSAERAQPLPARLVDVASPTAASRGGISREFVEARQRDFEQIMQTLLQRRAAGGVVSREFVEERVREFEQLITATLDASTTEKAEREERERRRQLRSPVSRSGDDAVESGTAASDQTALMPAPRHDLVATPPNAAAQRRRWQAGFGVAAAGLGFAVLFQSELSGHVAAVYGARLASASRGLAADLYISLLALQSKASLRMGSL